VKTQTTLAPPIGTYDPSTGHISVKVTDRFGVGSGGNPVTVSRTGFSETITTTEEGCAFFAQLNAGTYTIRLNRTGYVDGQGVTSPTRSMPVNVGFATPVTFLYDLASTLNLTLTGEPGYGVPAGIEKMISNTALQPAGKALYAGGLLFPYPDGFQAWGGNCADADPLGMNTTLGVRYYPSAQRDEPILVEPGLTATGQIFLKSVDVKVVNGIGVPVPNVALTARHVTNDLGCPVGKTLTLPGVTNAAGELQVAIPHGKWEFRVTGRSPAPVWPQIVLDPSAANPVAVQAVVL